MRARAGSGNQQSERECKCSHRSPARARLYYSQSDIISILTQVNAMGLSKEELVGLRDCTLEELDRMVNTIRTEDQ